MNQNNSFINWSLFAIILAVVMYILPWVSHNNAALSLSAYDFAEFLAKRPFDDRSYNAILALRGQLVFLTWLLAFTIQRPLFTLRWWAKTILCFLLIIAQLPPLTFITNIGDINQQQQALLSLSSLIGFGFGITGLLTSAKKHLWLVISIAGITTAIYGIINAVVIINDYTSITIGVGGIGLIVIYGIVSIANLWKIYRT